MIHATVTSYLAINILSKYFCIYKKKIDSELFFFNILIPD